MITTSARPLRPLVRIGWRSIRKAPLRSLLIFLLVGLVVAAGTFAAITNRSTSASADDVRLAEFGGSNFRADFETSLFGGEPAPLPVNIVVPPGAPLPVPTPQPVEAPGERPEAELDRLTSADVRDLERRIEDALGTDVSMARRSFINSFDGPFGSRGPLFNSISDIDLSHPAAVGTWTLEEGRAPLVDDEIALQDRGSSRGLNLGDHISIGEASLTIVGFTSNPASRHDGVAIVLPETFDQLVGIQSGTSVTLRANLAGGRTAAEQAAATVASITDRTVSARTPTSLVLSQGGGYTTYPGSPYTYGRVQPVVPRVWPILISTVLAVQIALVCAAAFAVGIRRRTKEFGQLMTLGADDRHVRQLAQVEAALLGITGAIFGLALGVIAASIAIPAGWLDSVGNRTPTGVRWSILDWLGPAAVGIAAVVFAAWWPIRVLARASIPAVLEGRLPAVAVKRTTPQLGLAIVGLGALLLALGAQTLGGGTPNPGGAFAMLVFGVAAMIGGSIFLIGTILSVLGRRADGLPLLARLAVRNSDRQRSRSWVVVGAFIAALAIPVLVGASIKAYPNSYQSFESGEFEGRLLTTSQVDYQRPSGDVVPLDGDLADFDRDFTNVIDELFPIAGTVDWVTAPQAQLSWVSGRGGYSTGQIVVATEDLRDLLDLNDELRRQLDEGAALNMATYRPAPRGEPQLGTFTPGGTQLPIETVDGPAIFQHDIWLVGQQTLDNIGAVSVTTGSLRLLEDRLNAADDDVIRQLGNALWTERFGAFSYNQRAALDGDAARAWLDLRIPRANDFGPSGDAARLWSMIVAFAIAVLVALVTSSLSAVEMNDDIESMIATGATPSIRRRLLGVQTLYHLLVAAMIAIPLALLAFWVATSTDDYRASPGLTVPWLSVGLTAVVIPLVVALVVSAIFRNGKPAVSRRLS